MARESTLESGVRTSLGYIRDGYQPTGSVDWSNPPRGGSGVPPLRSTNPAPAIQTPAASQNSGN